MLSYKVIPVVAGIIVLDGFVLLTKRHSMHYDTDDKWEFPGGKVERGETLEVALERELCQELVGLKVRVLDLVHAQMNYYSFGDAMVTYFNCVPILPYTADILSKKLEAVEHTFMLPTYVYGLTTLPGTEEALSHVI